MTLYRSMQKTLPAAFVPLLLTLALLLSACSFTIEANPTPLPPAPAAPGENPLLGTWQWEAGVIAGEAVDVAAPDRYTLTFQADGTVGAQFDCNSGGGSYTVQGEQLTFGALMTTLMGCGDDTQDYLFSAGLSDVVGYAVEGDMLTLDMSTDGDSMTLRRVE